MRYALVLALLALAGCATLPPEGFGTVPENAVCPAGTVKVCERPASELICRCQP